MRKTAGYQTPLIVPKRTGQHSPSVATVIRNGSWPFSNSGPIVKLPVSTSEGSYQRHRPGRFDYRLHLQVSGNAQYSPQFELGDRLMPASPDLENDVLGSLLPHLAAAALQSVDEDVSDVQTRQRSCDSHRPILAGPEARGDQWRRPPTCLMTHTTTLGAASGL